MSTTNEVISHAPPSLAREAVDSSTMLALREPVGGLQAGGLEATLIDPISGSAWDELLATHPSATAFHTSAWARVLTKTYGHKPFYLHFSRGGKSAALFPLMEVASRFTGRRGVCLPFSDFCDPLLFGHCGVDTLANALFDLVEERKWRYVEWRAEVPAPQVGVVAEPVTSFYGHTLDLSRGEEAVFARFHPSVQRAIRKAEKSALVVDISQNPAAMQEFYWMHCQTRKRHGVPPQPFAFFRHIQEELIAAGRGFIVLVRSTAGAIAAGVFFHFGDSALFKFGASDERHLGHRGNNLVIWQGIKRARDLGSQTLHFGRTGLEHAGLRRFKLSFRADENILRYYRFDPTRTRWLPPSPGLPSGLAAAVIRRLPLTVNRLAGTLVYPHLH